MTYADIEASRDEGRPLFLYRFAEASSIWRFTSRAQDWTAPGTAADATGSDTTWLARAIAHSEITVSGDPQDDGVEIVLPASDAFALRFERLRDGRETTVRIYRGHEQLPAETGLDFAGFVIGTRVDASGRRRVLRCESVLSRLRESGIRRTYQRLCDHPLYAGQCRLDIADFLAAATVTARSGPQLTVTEAANEDDGYYQGGVIRYAGIDADIDTHAGDTLTLLEPFPELQDAVDASAPVSVEIAPGCDRTTTTCDNRFDNILNHGGVPDLPADNPLDGTAII